MPKITYIEASGVEHVVDAKVGDSLMETAVRNGVPGIDGDCGGCCSCATCQVYIEPEWRATTGERNKMEQSMLSLADSVQDNSRLGCQIVVTEQLDGLVVRMPESQH